MEKSLSILLALKDHLQLSYPGLTTWTLSNDGTDVPVPVIQTDKTSKASSLTITLKSSGKSSNPDSTKTSGRKAKKLNEFQGSILQVVILVIRYFWLYIICYLYISF